MAAFPDLNPVPAQVTMNLRYSLTDTAYDSLGVSFQPRTTAGVAWDSSNLASLDVYFDNGQFAPLNLVSAKKSIASAAGSSTLITGVLQAGNASAVSALGTPNGRIRIVAGDGINNLTVGVGNYSVAIEP